MLGSLTSVLERLEGNILFSTIEQKKREYNSRSAKYLLVVENVKVLLLLSLLALGHGRQVVVG
jgi:hypothetical protein